MLQNVNRKARVFLSYAHVDRDRVLPLYKKLKRAGLDPWLDEKDLYPGQPWRETVLNAIEDADFVIWSGDPLEGQSAAEQVYIDGVRQPLATHQSRLLERYRYLPRRELPEAYRK